MRAPSLLRLHLALLVAIELVYALVVVLLLCSWYPQLPPVLYPQLPPAAVTVFLFLDPTGIAGGVFHAVVFTLLGVRVLRHGSAPSTAPRRLLLPSFTVVGAVAALSVLSLATSVDHAARYQGLVYMAFYAVLDVVAITALVVAALRIRRRALGGAPVGRSLLWLHAGLHVALLLVFFPYLGEVP